MAKWLIIFAWVQALTVQNAYTQCVNRLPNCGCSQQVVTETCVQNPVLVQNPPNICAQTNLISQPTLVGQPNLFAQSNIIAQPGYVGQNIIAQPNIVAQSNIIAQPNYLANVGIPAVSSCDLDYLNQYAVSVPGATIIQDDSVANNLANALQLLIVSNLLGNTLPLPCNDVLNVGIAQPALQYAQPALQYAQPALQYVSGCGNACGCGCGCGGLKYVL